MLVSLWMVLSLRYLMVILLVDLVMALGVVELGEDVEGIEEVGLVVFRWEVDINVKVMLVKEGDIGFLLSSKIMFRLRRRRWQSLLFRNLTW